MKIIRNAQAFQRTLELERRKGRSIGFVPTMGALHKGHLALVEAARKKNKITAVSVFVNPAQFGPSEDFSKYPRVLAQDSKLLKVAGVDYLFYPSVKEIYPEGCVNSVKLDPSASFTNVLCGRFRPGHFDGVATVVAKLFILSGSCNAYFGAKDYQQTVVIRRLVSDMLLPVRVVVCPTVREKDGLAMSSRNRYLNAEERKSAVRISQVLFAIKKSLRSLRSAKVNLTMLRKQAIQSLEQEGLRVQYFELVDPITLAKVETLQPRILVATACFCGKTRLIDNVIIHAQNAR